MTDGRYEIYVIRFEILKGMKDDFLKLARSTSDRRHKDKAQQELAWNEIEEHVKAVAELGCTYYGGKSFIGGEQAAFVYFQSVVLLLMLLSFPMT
jgi:hypothetical protein